MLPFAFFLFAFLGLLFLIFRHPILSFLEKRFRVLKGLGACLDCRLENPLKTVFLPIVFSILLVFLLSLFAGKIEGPKLTLWYAILTVGFLNPIGEEVLWRGAILGFAFLTFIPRSRKKRKKPAFSSNYKIFVFLLVSFAFVLAHGFSQSSSQLIYRYFLSLLIGIIYLAGNKNLLPAIVAHSVFNLIAILFGT